jgi:CheY-like chemotaxis protein
MEDLLLMALPETVNLTITCEDGPMLARIDPGQLESAILNLCVNAGQAIADDGQIEIGVARQPDGKIALSVRDNGCGMDADTLRQAAEPFFSARPDGEGTGLGLSMVHGFVHQSGGSIQIDSQPEQGTRVTLLFPQQHISSGSSPLPSLQGPALVIDDDRKSADAISSLLDKLGYSVTTVHTFEEAQSMIRQSGPLAAVVTDLQLDNGHSGWDMVPQILDRHADCRLVVVSGHLPKEAPVSHTYRNRFAMFSKPVSETELVAYLSTSLQDA